MTSPRKTVDGASAQGGEVSSFASRLRQTYARTRRRLLSFLSSGEGVQAQTARVPYTSETIDLNDPEVAADPFPHYEELRRGGSVHFLPRQGFWLVLGYDDVHAALARPQVFSSRVEEWTAVDKVLLGADPPRHTAVRRVVGRLFSAEALEAQTAFAERAAEKLLRPFRAGEPLDVLRGFAAPLSEEVAADLIGFDGAALDAMRAAQAEAQDLGRWLAALDAVIADAADGTRAYGQLLRDGGGTFSDAEVRSLIRFLWLAGTTTTRRVIASSVLMLLLHPAAREEVEADPSLLPAFAEESLRLHPPEHTVARVAAVEVELSGVLIPAGAHVKLCVGAANRDPARFEEPASFLLRRAAPRHLSFGGGIHRCLGAALSRATTAEALRALLRLAPRFRAAQPPDTLPYAGFTNDTERLLIER